MMRPLGLFDAFGVELEYMIVDAQSLDVMPICDQLLQQIAGEITGEVEFGSVAWSNELALHVLEIKVAEPTSDLERLHDAFVENVQHANRLLNGFGARLLPSAMHPWMDPDRELRLWPHDYSEVYNAFNQVFNCKGHGWANLQSTHWNLPFANDEQFGRLHAAIRIVLPLLPALAASSPVYGAMIQPQLDARLEVYRHNSARIPSIAGRIVPEAVFNEEDYDREIFQRMYRDIAPFDTQGVLQHIWLNARGAIARFDRGSIEIRVLDIQECPCSDLAIGTLMIEFLRELCEQDADSFARQKAISTDLLADLMIETIRVGGDAELPQDLASLLARGSTGNGNHLCTVREFWQYTFESNTNRIQPSHRQALEQILFTGSLAERILSRLPSSPSHADLHTGYRLLADCLSNDQLLPTH